MYLSSKTKEGLRKGNLTVPTDIQAAAIPHALAGRDILGAAKTGSGKTLAFIVPVLEKLFAESWDLEDGLGAIIISPTRELALQIFEVLRIAGRKHSFSAGLVTGGKKEFEGEQERIVKMNILVATPGRLLQHLEQTPGFDASRIQILVLDEADRILDMGFKTQLDSILEYLPQERQTLLFSATQTKSVKDLARLSLKDPEYIAVHAEHAEATPKQLQQNYIVCPLQDKLDVLFSFIKSHLKSKIIVFMSTCSQVRFVFECFSGMQPGIPLIALHGKIKQEKRTMVFMDFARRKSACLFATDIAARGLDFPNVDWVFQLDAPEDSAMYIHRVGRTARYQSGGRALMALLPTEERAVVDHLKHAGVELKKLSVNPNRSFSVATQAASLLVSRPECRLLAKKAFTGYLKSLLNLPTTGHQSHPVDLLKLPIDAFANSLGLAFTPPLPAAPQGASNQTKEKKNVNRALDKLKRQIKEAKEKKRQALAEGKQVEDEGSDGESSIDEKDAEMQKMIKTYGKKKARLLMQNRSLRPVLQAGEGETLPTTADDDDDFLVVKKVHNLDTIASNGAAEASDEDDAPLMAKTSSKKALQRKLGKIKVTGESAAVDVASIKHYKFDEEGEAGNYYGNILVGDKDVKLSAVDKDLEDRVSAHKRSIKERVDAVRLADEERDKARVKEKHKKVRIQAREERIEKSRASAGDTGATAFLSNYVEEGEDEDQWGSDGDEGFGGGSDNDDVSRASADSDADSEPRRKGKKRRASSIDSSEEKPRKHKKKSSSKKEELSIAEQEALALKLLQSR